MEIKKQMLTEHEKAEIDKEVAKFPFKESACLEALMIVQHGRGYVSDESLKAVAEYLEMSATELDSIATFYNLIYRKPVGKKVVRICDSVTCWIMGYDQIRDKICSHVGASLGETSKDGAFTILPTQCLGTCDRAPAMLVGEDLHRDLTTDNVTTILDSYRQGGH
jgi:NADH-quinone oxidoreductase subunit E